MVSLRCKMVVHQELERLCIKNAVVDLGTVELMDDISAGQRQTLKENLLKTAISLRVDPKRLVFGQRMDASDYLARYKSANLFLDTHPYNAGTTASDALWVGLPVITRIGKSFASRMAASALKGVGLQEMITQSCKEYEELAIKLGNNKQFYDFIQAKLKRQKDQSLLFDPAYFTKTLEKALEKVVQHAQSGLPAQTLRLQQFHEV
jgi:predicted O-linked N-acetylglucosamine transferase (SPINDLY family)